MSNPMPMYVAMIELSQVEPTPQQELVLQVGLPWLVEQAYGMLTQA